VDTEGIASATGVLLAGGQARRLGGVPKGTLRLGEETLAARTVALFRRLFPRVLVVTNDPAPYLGLGVPVVADVIAGKGAPGGVHAALCAARTPWIFAAACDMPFLDERLIALLAGFRPGCAAVIPRFRGLLEPLHAFYSRECLEPLTRLLREGSPRLQDLAGAVGARIVDEEAYRAVDPDGRSFANANTPEELAAFGLALSLYPGSDRDLGSGARTHEGTTMPNDSIRVEGLVRATPWQVYQAWMDSELHSTMTGAKASVEPGVGGHFTAWDGYIEGKTIELQPGYRIVQAWRTSEFPDGSGDSRLEVRLEAAGDQTRVIIFHTEIPEGQGKQYEEGWAEFYLAPMATHFAPEEKAPAKHAAAKKPAPRKPAKKTAAAKKAKPRKAAKRVARKPVRKPKKKTKAKAKKKPARRPAKKRKGDKKRR
jgi:molybdopterin-guanine dinucleotide biosynthesis protein A